MLATQTISPCLWFDGNAEEAAAFYLSVFPKAKPGPVLRCGEAGPGPVGSVLTVSFELEGVTFTALNGGPQFHFTEAVSFVVHCKSQDEIDHYWRRLGEDGGQTSQCGWLKDRFGVSWQIAPDRLLELIASPDPAVAARVMRAMMTMTKIDLAAIERAAAG